MGGDPAELAYGHALAMLGDPDAAAAVAITALRRAGRARGLVLAHAREQAVAGATRAEPVDIASLQTVVLDLPALAATLASTRPPEERAALDVRARTSGDLALLGEALGMRPTDAADKCNEIAELWERTLDPAMLAFSGAGECETLAEILQDADTETVAGLLAVAPAIHAHAQEDTACGDRLRAMAPVRSFFSDTGVEVPDEVREAGRISRTKRPSAAPVPLFGSAAPATERVRGVITPRRVAAALALLLAAGTAIGIATRDTSPSELTKLTELANDDALVLAPAQVSGSVAIIEVRNTTDRAVAFTATASEPWVHIATPKSRVAARGTRSLTLTALDSAPEGVIRATINVMTLGGAGAVEEIEWTIERAPDLDATATGCDVKVNVVEEGDLASVVLHWRDLTGEHSVDITSGAEGYNAELAPEGQDLTYWVTALDARGNQARTADQTIPGNAC